MPDLPLVGVGGTGDTSEMTAISAALAIAALALGAGACAAPSGPAADAPALPEPIDTFTASGNPMFDGADPHAIVIGETLWVYTTRSFERGVRGFWAFASEDLENWRVYGPVLDYADIGWINDLDERTNTRRFAWAPALAERADGQLAFLYSAGPQDPIPSLIGVAVGATPAGPFRDIGTPLIEGALGEFEAIDPMVYTDPASGTSYLYAGGSNPGTMKVWELNEAMTEPVREVEVDQPERFTEGAFMHEHDGRYYLTYSSGGWRDASYSVHVSESDSPTGSWDYQGAILVSDDRHKGPGHHSIVESPHTGEPFIVYHRWNDREGNGPYEGERATAIEPLRYDADGHLMPVTMTDTGVSAARWRGEE